MYSISHSLQNRLTMMVGATGPHFSPTGTTGRLFKFPVKIPKISPLHLSRLRHISLLPNTSPCQIVSDSPSHPLNLVFHSWLCTHGDQLWRLGG